MPSISTPSKAPITRIVSRGRDRWEKRRITQGSASSSGAALDAHEAALDPHPQYLTETEVDLLYADIAHTHTASDITDFEEAVEAVSGSAGRWEPLTTGDHTSPELVFVEGDVVMVFVEE